MLVHDGQPPAPSATRSPLIPALCPASPPALQVSHVAQISKADYLAGLEEALE
jgi:hypothetical protein